MEFDITIEISAQTIIIYICRRCSLKILGISISPKPIESNPLPLYTTPQLTPNLRQSAAREIATSISPAPDTARRVHSTFIASQSHTQRRNLTGFPLSLSFARAQSIDRRAHYRRAILAGRQWLFVPRAGQPASVCRCRRSAPSETLNTQIYTHIHT